MIFLSPSEGWDCRSVLEAPIYTLLARDQVQGFVSTRQTLYKMSYTPSSF